MRHLPAAKTSPTNGRRCVRTGIAALSAGCSLMVIGAVPAPALAMPCVAPGPVLSTHVARADHPDGTSELTEFLPGGSYRVTRCTEDGGWRVSQTVSPIPDPDGGVTLVPTDRQVPGAEVASVYGDASDPAWGAAFRASRSALQASVIAPTARSASPPDPMTTTTPLAGDACTNGQYATWQSSWWGRSYSYYVNRSRFAYNDTIVASIAAGHTAWDRTYNDCGFANITSLTSHLLGSSTATAHTAADGVSVIDKGDLAGVGCAGALACTWLFNNTSGASSESDTRFSDAVSWSTVGAGGAYDYQSVATHESGHTIGLDHANSSSALTMFFTIGTGTTQARTLARGDVLGLRARYG